MQFTNCAFRPVGSFGFDARQQPVHLQQAQEDQARGLNFGKGDNTVDDFLAQEVVVQESMQESIQGFMMDQDHAPRNNAGPEFPHQLSIKDAFQRFDRFLMATGIEKYRKQQEHFRPHNCRFPSMPDLNSIANNTSNTVSDGNYSAALSDLNFAGTMPEFSSPFARAKDMRVLTTDFTHADSSWTAPSARMMKSEEQLHAATSRPKLVKQGSVDDFLADERARCRSVSDFLNAVDPPSAAGVSSSSHYFSIASSGSAPSLSSLSSAPSSRPSAPISTEPLHAKKPRLDPAPTVPRLAPARKPAPAARRPAARRDAAEAAQPEAAAAGGDGGAAGGEDSAEARERRRREQNREAQRRFRERSKYREFQAFSRRLAAAAAGPAAGFL
jgi:hypothetical protein